MSNRHLLVGWVLLIPALACAPAEEPTASSEQTPATLDLYKEASLRFAPLPSAAPNPDNPVTQAKIELGKKLYFDTRLSKEGNISCNSCHNLATFGVDNEATSEGDDGSFGDRNSPTVLNAALHQTQFWDGRARDVEEQAGMPILNAHEARSVFVVKRSLSPGYAGIKNELFEYDNTMMIFGDAKKVLQGLIGEVKDL